MSDISRRDALRRLGLVLAATGFVDRAAAQEVHQMAGEARAASGGMYSPKALSAHDYETLKRLTDLIIPVENGAPGALAAGAAAWIDMMASENAELKGIYTKGLGWLDTTMVQRGQKDSRARTGHRVLLLGPADDRRRVLHERDRDQGHRLPRQHATDDLCRANAGDRVRIEKERAGLVAGS
jgi:hypothetical protein